LQPAAWVSSVACVTETDSKWVLRIRRRSDSGEGEGAEQALARPLARMASFRGTLVVRAGGARDDLRSGIGDGFADLTETRPDVVLDMPGHLKGVSLRAVPELLGHMKEHYCEMPAIRAKDGRAATPWLRRGTARCP